MFFKDGEKALLEELRSLGARLAEDRIYEKVIAEVENNELDAVAKAKAFEEAEGDASKARAFYIKHRVRRIRDLAAEYEIWLQQEADKKEAIRKREQELADHRRILSEKMSNGAMPPMLIAQLAPSGPLEHANVHRRLAARPDRCDRHHQRCHG